MGFFEQGNAGGIWKNPCGACVSCGELCVRENGKASCDGCQRQKVTCNLSRWKPCGAKARRKGGSIIHFDEDAQRELELKRQKVSPVSVMEIQQPAGSSLSLFQDLLAMLRDHVAEQQKQTAILEWIARIQEMDQEDWAFN